MLDILRQYQIGPNPVNSTAVPLRGRNLGRSLRTATEAAFAGCDLHTGRKVLTEPTLAQCALITGASITSVWWAEQRQEHRDEILRGLLPLTPARQRKPSTVIDDVHLVNVIRDLIGQAGVDRFLAAAATAEQTH